MLLMHSIFPSILQLSALDTSATATNTVASEYAASTFDFVSCKILSLLPITAIVTAPALAKDMANSDPMLFAPSPIMIMGFPLAESSGHDGSMVKYVVLRYVLVKDRYDRLIIVREWNSWSFVLENDVEAMIGGTVQACRSGRLVLY